MSQNTPSCTVTSMSSYTTPNRPTTRSCISQVPNRIKPKIESKYDDGEEENNLPNNENYTNVYRDYLNAWRKNKGKY